MEAKLIPYPQPPVAGDDRLVQYINLRLAWIGCPTVDVPGPALHEMASGLLAHHRETARLLEDYLSPADRRIQEFLDVHLRSTNFLGRLPTQTFVLDRPGLARALSLPVRANAFHSDIVQSFRVHQGVLHNPKSDRRTTAGSFHIVQGGPAVPDDKRAVPKAVFAHMLTSALEPPRGLMRLPFASAEPNPAECWVSLLIRPIVRPEIPGHAPVKTMEIRLFAPGGLVSNLDFVETIFGNAGDPLLPENNAALDVEHWTGHTGCIILAPHLTALRKRDAGLPSWDEANERQRRDGMCWRNPDELYNDGAAFKLTCRDASGVIVTLVADNYFGYCKKEVKTQISYAANLFGGCEEEHAGGALVFPSYDLGEEYGRPPGAPGPGFDEVLRLLDGAVERMPDGSARDRHYPDIVYVPADARFDLHHQCITWSQTDGPCSAKLLPGRSYVRPSGYRTEMEKPPGARAWRLVGTVAAPTLCHKPSTVSGGGKSEISKPITDAILEGPVFVADFNRDFDEVARLLEHDYSDRFRHPPERRDTRPVLSPQRSLGSVIKLLTPSSEYSDAYNAWLDSIPPHIVELVFVVRRFYKPDWGDRWREQFSVDVINGAPGNELKLHNRKLVANYLRVGYEPDGLWRTFGLRKDFHPAAKLSVEDDITASTVVPARDLPTTPRPVPANSSAKLVVNCEQRLFQRPDDAIRRGQDRTTEADFAQSDMFFSNYEALPNARAKELIEDSIGFSEYTEPMQRLIREVAGTPQGGFFITNAQPRLVDGKPTKNPRYLQVRPDLAHPRDRYLADVVMRLDRGVPIDAPFATPVDAVLPGRRNNPPDPVARIRPLAVFNPIHLLELPEAFLEFICSMTGKSPSTTGAGSEGALTKGPFNALPAIFDLNSALVSYMLCRYQPFVTAAGYIGPKVRVDHDISLLVPEIWSRMSPEDRDPACLIREGFLERCEDFEFQGKRVLASRLGYRITRRFVRSYFGRVFNHPNSVITDEMLRPETQDLAVFADGMDNIVESQRRIATAYFDDGSVEHAAAPLKALLHIMRDGTWEGCGLGHPRVRGLFSFDGLRGSDWYQARLRAKQEVDARLGHRHVRSLEAFLQWSSHAEEAKRLDLAGRLERARARLERIESPAYLEELQGTIGADPALVALR